MADPPMTPPMILDFAWLVSLATILLLAYFVRGIAGFGSGLLAVPLLAHFMPLTFVVPYMLVLDFTASLVLGGVTWREVDWQELKPLWPGSLIGVLLGTVWLIRLPRAPLLLGLGGLVMGFALRLWWVPPRISPVSRLWAIPAGLLGGLVSGLFGTGGPPYVIYLTHRLANKQRLRASFSALFTLEGGIRLVISLAAGLLNQDGLWTALVVGWMAQAAGLLLGHQAHLGLTDRQMTRGIAGLLGMAGASLLARAMI
ncbi:putative membrane transporter protein [Gammaproteobacteria bacterium]